MTNDEIDVCQQRQIPHLPLPSVGTRPAGLIIEILILFGTWDLDIEISRTAFLVPSRSG